MGLFITGTDTGVGKTHTLVQLLRLLRSSGIKCAGMKPICCGDRHDAELLVAAGSDDLTIDEINPVWMKQPVAPLSAALLEQKEIDVARILDAFAQLQKKVEHVFVEGVGGWMVPIRADYFVRDLAAQMNLPVLVVSQNRLGCLNHTALTVESVVRAGLDCAGVVLNSDSGAPTNIATQTNSEILRMIIKAPIVSGLAEEMDTLPSDWRELLSVVLRHKMSGS